MGGSVDSHIPLVFWSCQTCPFTNEAPCRTVNRRFWRQDAPQPVSSGGQLNCELSRLGVPINSTLSTASAERPLVSPLSTTPKATRYQPVSWALSCPERQPVFRRPVSPTGASAAALVANSTTSTFWKE